MISVKKIIGLVMLIVMGITLFYLSQPKVSQPLAANQINTQQSPSNYSSLNANNSEETGGTSQKNEIPSLTKNFNYQREVKYIEELKKQYPSSKKELVRIITAPDLFKVGNISVPPHSLNEITQRQMGATKVLALKTLMILEKSKPTLLSDLDLIIDSAQDSTLKDITRAAKDSLEKGRPFFKDTIDALSNLEQ